MNKMLAFFHINGLGKGLAALALVALMFVATGVWLVNRQEKGDG